MRKVINNGLWRTAYDTEKSDLVLRYIPGNFISQWLKYPMIEVYRGKEHGIPFKVYIFPWGNEYIRPISWHQMEELVVEYFEEDSETFKKYGPKIMEA